MSDYGDLIQKTFSDGISHAAANLDADPEEAARAIQLGQSSGVDPSVVGADVEGFEKRQRAALASSIVANNQHINTYVQSHPMAAKVSNDDYGQLDKVSEVLGKVRSAIGQKATTAIAAKAFKGAKEGFGDPNFGEWMFNSPESAAWIERHPLSAAAWSVLGMPIEAGAKVFGGGLGALRSGLDEAANQFGFGKDLARDLAGMVEYQFINPARGGVNPQLLTAIKTAGPWLAGGRLPPTGLHPLIDQLKVEQSKADVKNLDEALRESQASKTRERAPELFAEFVRQHTDTKIGISADAVRKLYGEKQPHAEDNLLGWVPGIEDQLRLAETVGGDVEIPIADWLAKVDPKVADELHDNIRVQPEGLTIEEGKNLPPTQELMQEDPVAAVRQSAGLDPFADRVPEGWEAIEAPKPELRPEDEWERFGSTTIAKTKLFTENQERIKDEVEKVLNRIVPRALRTQAATELEVGAKPIPGQPEMMEGGRRVRGLYQLYIDRLPLIIYTLDHDDPIGTARHEAIHHLRQMGFFTPEEWDTLKRAAMDNGWVKKHDINTRYADVGAGLQLEEAIAEEFREWRGRPDAPYEAGTGEIFAKIQQLIEKIKEAVSSIVGFKPTWEDLFTQVEGGEIGGRLDTKPLRPEAFEPLAQEEPIAKKASAIGMTEPQMKRYMKLIDRLRQEDEERQVMLASKDIRRRQTKEWKENESRIREEVKGEAENRPDIYADRVLRDRNLYLDSDKLTAEQRKLIPNKKGGIDPDTMAGFFGYQTGEQLKNRLQILADARKTLKMSPEEYFKKVVDGETERRMKKQYGDLEENILTEAQDHVVSETQLDLLHEETLALGLKAGSELPLGKDDLKTWVRGEFNKAPVGGHKVDTYLAAAGKAGKAAEMALLKEDPSEAFRQKQRQYMAMLMAQEAKKLGKQMDQFDRNAKRFSKREVSSVPQEYTNFIHDILIKVGKPVRRSIQDLRQSIANGEHSTLEDFVDAKQADLRELDVADFLLDPNFRKPLDQLSTEDFRAVHDSIKTLIKNGRDEKKIYLEAEEYELNDIKQQMIEGLQNLGIEKKIDVTKPSKRGIAHTIKTAWASLLQMESLLNRWDKADPKGVWTQFIMRPLSEASNYEAKLERKYGRMLGAIADKVDLNERISNNLFLDPLDGKPMAFNRKNLRAILQNVGNRSNLDKLARGYSVSPDAVMQWLHQNAKKEDWDWAQKQGDIFARLKQESDVMYQNLSGIEPEAIPLRPIQTPHGTYSGWYHPIVYSSEFEGTSKKLMGGDALEQDNYLRATTPRGYTKARTGYAAPLSLHLDETPNRMRQIIHDIAFRPAIIQASKIFYDRDVRASVTRNYGEVYRDLLVPYLKDVANSANFRSDAQAVGARVSEFLRQNIIGTLIGFNPGTVAKHGPTAAINSMTEVGTGNFLKAVKDLLSTNDQTGESNWKFAINTSEELQRRHRNYVETLRGGQEKVLGETSLRDFILKAGATPVAISDMLSAVPTWLAKYREVMQETGVHGDAVSQADRAVRRAHGSVVITNRPAAMRGGPMAQWMTSLYGFFSHILNRQFEMMWKASDTLGLAKEGEYKQAAARMPELTGMFFSYVIFPALVEEMVTPLSNDQHESWGKWAAKTVGKGLSSSWPVIRDLADFAISGYRREPSVGLYSAAFKAYADAARDLGNVPQKFTKSHAGDLIQHGVTAFGALTGLANAQEGKTGKFIYNYASGQEHPRNLGQWWRGLRTGTTKERK